MKKIITIEIEEPRQAHDNLADLLCWWQGYMAGLKAAAPYTDTNFVADNGIATARIILNKIKAALCESN